MSKFIAVITIVLIVFGLITALVWYLKPQQVKHTFAPSLEFVEPQQQVQASEKTKKMLDADAPIPTFRTILTESNQQKLFQQRDAIYIELGDIAMQMMSGQKPDLRHVSDLLQQQQKLVKQGVISQQDAQIDLEFWLKVFPEMSHELDIHLKEIEQTSKK
jgi:hypothetical protein